MAQHPNYRPQPQAPAPFTQPQPSLLTMKDEDNPYRLAVGTPTEKDDFIDIPVQIESEGKADERPDAISVTEDSRRVINFNAWIGERDPKVDEADIILKLDRELSTETIEDLMESACLSHVSVTRVTVSETKYDKN
ncbi:hypothetical protein Goe5_c01820 [Bacillus phage vB_BthM-Goe5]|nr:hypothetical protein Goe5_c01820 [Bacillus phage vB_BthM-Goe5]